MIDIEELRATRRRAQKHHIEKKLQNGYVARLYYIPREMVEEVREYIKTKIMLHEGQRLVEAIDKKEQTL